MAVVVDEGDEEERVDDELILIDMTRNGILVDSLTSFKNPPWTWIIPHKVNKQVKHYIPDDGRQQRISPASGYKKTVP